MPPSSVNSLSAASSDVVPSISEDDWAFAQDLMSRYGDQEEGRRPVKAKHRQQASSVRNSLTPRTRSTIQASRVRRASVPPAASTPTNRPKSSSAPRTDLAKPRNRSSIPRQRRDSRQTTPSTATMKYVPLPGSSPSPSFRPLSLTTPGHARAIASGSPSGVRSESLNKRRPGILKHAKSVRFADVSKPDDTNDNSSSASQPRMGTPKGAGGSPSLQPSPLRACFVPEELEVQPLTRQPCAIPATEAPTRLFKLDRHSSVQLTPSQTVNLRSSVFNSPTLSVTPGVSDTSPPSNNSRAVKRLSLLVQEQVKDKEKENSPLALRTQKRARRNTEVDENTARRAIRSEGASRKHRLSSPLKSFLERLRA
jgi:hypothetical protein